VGPAWTERGRPAAGCFTKRTAEAWLCDLLDQAGRGTLPGMLRTGVTFAAAAEEYLHHLEHDRERKHSTLRDYRSIIAAHLLPEFGDMAVEDLTAEGIEAWATTLPVANRTKVKILTILNGVLERARRQYRLPRNPMKDVDKPGHRRKVAGLSVFTVEEVMSLARAGESEQDAAIFLVAAFTGLRRGELVALCWRDVDFALRRVRVTASYTRGGTGSDIRMRLRRNYKRSGRIPACAFCCTNPRPRERLPSHIDAPRQTRGRQSGA